ncbi:MAG: hypothetical protein HY716_14930 [Planctomycetes bacterium]|nr:hypothetical protein [Planctomycetota bacterium]
MSSLRTALWAFPLLLCAFQADDRKSAKALLDDGKSLESEARETSLALSVIVREIAAIDARIDKIEAQRRKMEAERERSSAAEDRLREPLARLDAERKPLDARRARLEARRAELEEKKHLARALDKYRKAAEKAGAENRKDVLAGALLGMARVHEMSVPENIAEAQAAYAKIVSQCADQAAEAAFAREKIAQKGVDVYLAHFEDFVTRWRDYQRNDPAPLEEKKKEIWSRIQALGGDAVHGLLAGAGHRDEIVREFAAQKLAEVIDEAGLARLVSKLNDPAGAMRAGAATALKHIFRVWNEARAYDQRAQNIRNDLGSLKSDSPEATALIEKQLQEAEKLGQRAADLRRGIPKDLAAARGPVETELDKLLRDEKAHPVSRIEAAKTVEAIGDISGMLAEALLQGLQSKDRSVREACAVAAGVVDTADFTAKHKLADRLMAVLQYRPETDEKPMAERDLANDEHARAAAAVALGRIGVVKSIPALISALSDPSLDVRTAANDALKEITGKDMGYDPNPFIPGAAGADQAPSQADIARLKQEKRQEGIDQWLAWWADTQGVPVLVERFWKFQATWKASDPADVFDKAYFMERQPDAPEQRAHAERIAGRFHAVKDFMEQDAVDLGAPALEKLIPFLSGACDLDKNLPDLQPKSRAVIRLFVAETITKLIQKLDASDQVAAFREKLSTGSRDEKVGAALTLGFLPSGMVTDADREALERRGLDDADALVKEAAARALARVGDPKNGPALSRVAADNAAGEAAQIAALRAIAALKPKSEEVVSAVGELVGGESDSKRARTPLVRKYGCEALGAIGDPAALRSRALLRARRDITEAVREAARRAIVAIGQGASEESIAVALEVLKPEAKTPSLDRSGAALALGDLASPACVRPLLYRVVDENAPLLMKDGDPTVRAACAEALGNMGAAAKYALVGEKLIEALSDRGKEVQRHAYQALRKIAYPSSPPDFKPEDKAADLAIKIENIRVWFEQERANWKELGP